VKRKKTTQNRKVNFQRKNIRRGTDKINKKKGIITVKKYKKNISPLSIHLYVLTIGIIHRFKDYY